MKLLELFAGTGEVSAAFRDRGFDTFEVDWNEKFDSDLHCDIGTLTTQEVIDRFGVPDVMWMAFDCTTYSLAAISHHRSKNKVTGNLDPVSDYAKRCDEIDVHCLEMLCEFQKLNPSILFFIENPRAGMQNMWFMRGLEPYKHTVTYCKYMTDVPVNERRMKPTNIWTNHPNPDFIKPCTYGDPCHPVTPRGSKTFGTQALKGSKERSRYPKLLIDHIADISKDFVENDHRALPEILEPTIYKQLTLW